MRIACIGLNSSLINCEEQSRVIRFLSSKLYEIGENVSLISYFDNMLESVKSIIKDYEIVFIIGTDSSIYNGNIKENIARVLGDKLTNFEATYASMTKFCQSANIPMSVSEEREIMLPSKSIPLCDSKFYNNGFIFRDNTRFVVFLPDNLEFAKLQFVQYISPVLSDLLAVLKEKIILKCFGLLEKDLKTLISEYYNHSSVSINVVSDDIDNTIYIRYSSAVDLQVVQEIVSNICSKLSKFIYATEDVTIFEMATQLLKFQNKTLSIGETLTYGNITKMLSISGNTSVTNAYLFGSFESIKNQLKIDNKVIENFGKYSVNSVYELANTLLNSTGADISMFVLGDIDSSDICYIAIGDIDGIHVYKNKINKKSNLIETVSKTAIFYLIKKLKQNDLQFR